MPFVTRPAALARRAFFAACLATLAAAVVAPVPRAEASGRGGVRIEGEILDVRCDDARPSAVCRIGDRRAIVSLANASIFVNGQPARCGALQAGRKFAAYGKFVSRDPLVFEACVFVSRSETDRVVTLCGEITRISAPDGLFVLSLGDRGSILVQTDPDLTRFSVDGRRATIDDLAPGMRACATGLIDKTDRTRTMRPTHRVEARSGRR
jgi:hypothetical protein